MANNKKEGSALNFQKVMFEWLRKIEDRVKRERERERERERKKERKREARG